ncbi:c-type cytochrome [Pontibacter fetidus]|uniref:Cytochrome c n=1 Tax=Pontibacter fetidus TaxID=2700082 RepID=A0A6B2H785_9BACT|nr:cytochrome c [Pontibacter fetidus]NDK55790.1 cytochrome c [Pontibacter fetidus]
MADRIISTSFGIKLIYGSLFVCFLFFTAFVYTSQVPDTTSLPTRELALQGKHIWQKQNCGACHQFYGLGGYIGPDVTNVISAKGKGETYVRAILTHGTATMPNFNLTLKDIDALVAFLQEADKTGKSERHHFMADTYGQIHPKGNKPPQK